MTVIGANKNLRKFNRDKYKMTHLTPSSSTCKRSPGRAVALLKTLGSPGEQ